MSSNKKITAHYACRNADLNLLLVAATTNRFQIIDSLMESMGVRLTCCVNCNQLSRETCYFNCSVYLLVNFRYLSSHFSAFM